MSDSVNTLWLLLLPVAAGFGYYSAIRSRKKQSHENRQDRLRNSYLSSLNYIVNERPDKAVDLFVNNIEVDTETIETHLAIGKLFRRRGEIDRAIRVHQNIVAQTQLDKRLRYQALFALAKDYLNAGVLDRAEDLFLELVKADYESHDCVHSLLYIYQQEKAWQQAVNVAEQHSALLSDDGKVSLAHYYCQLAQTDQQKGQQEQAFKKLRRALYFHPNCIRASLSLVDLLIYREQYSAAWRQLQKVKEKHPEWITEVLPRLQTVYIAMGRSDLLITYLQDIVVSHPQAPVLNVLLELIQQYHGDQAALSYARSQVERQPGQNAILNFVHLKVSVMTQPSEDWSILKQALQSLYQTKDQFRCVHCGFKLSTLHWQCPSCHHWETVKHMFVNLKR